MITSIWIDNFKSLVDFKIELAKFNCVVGLNGAGKSTLLHALDFISQLMVGDISGWPPIQNKTGIKPIKSFLQQEKPSEP